MIKIPMFSAGNGYFFSREGFDVILSKGTDFSNAQEIARFTGNTWASIVATVCAKGENSATFILALNLHLYGSTTSPNDI